MMSKNSHFAQRVSESERVPAAILALYPNNVSMLRKLIELHLKQPNLNLFIFPQQVFLVYTFATLNQGFEKKRLQYLIEFYFLFSTL